MSDPPSPGLRRCGQVTICTWVIALIACDSGNAPAADSLRDFIHVDGQRLVAPEGNDFRIQAIGAGSTGADPAEKDYAEIAHLNLNTVTVMLGYRRFHEEDAPDKYIELAWKRLDQHLAFARKYGLRVILQMLSVDGAQFVPSKGEAFDYRIWVQPRLQERFLKLWEAIADRYKDERQILGYGIFCEPLASGTRQQWIDLANKAVARIRNVDKNHVLLLSVFTENSERAERCLASI
jgi:aryl-phospho-beta-D-glucosidase BglC (GH1 family)